LRGRQRKPPPDLRIRGIEHLESAIEQEAGALIGAHPAADRIVGLEDLHGYPCRGQIGRARQAGQPGTAVPRREAHEPEVRHWAEKSS
jgi:hypothetical protein